eukprot:m.42694 g.42694  ORF g.42694 m.42694 type:complete len:238 (+) comp6103_c0_seq2:268-981(+)
MKYSWDARHGALIVEESSKPSVVPGMFVYSVNGIMLKNFTEEEVRILLRDPQAKVVYAQRKHSSHHVDDRSHAASSHSSHSQPSRSQPSASNSKSHESSHSSHKPQPVSDSHRQHVVPASEKPHHEEAHERDNHYTDHTHSHHAGHHHGLHNEHHSHRKVFTKEEVKQHNTKDSCWITLMGRVYDVTEFLAEHPGGEKSILKVAGKDATFKFQAYHRWEEVIKKYGPRLCIGVLDSS